ncbi:MAG: hypothetical protein ACF8TS_00235 [Maioricimonas sp. JB049]
MASSAVPGLACTSGDGTSGTIIVRMNLEDDDTLLITLELPQPITIRMKRAGSE